jgi:GAF domain-containing protein
MRWLNSRVPYRYSAVFRFEGDTLHSICLIDKEDTTVSGCTDQPISDSYCTYIRQSLESFGVEDSQADGRVEGHPKQRVFQSYYGVPLFTDEGHIVGTLCHFDDAPIRVTDDVASTLDELAPIVAKIVL